MATMRARLCSGTAFTLLLTTSPFVAQAQTAEDPVVLETIVLTAEEQIKQALGVSNISAEDLEKQPVVNDIAEAVRKMPGVNLTGSTASGQRGNQRQIDLRGMGPENTLILIDGKPVTSRNAVKMGRGGERDTRGDSNWVAPELIERIEVLRGPAAARYGSGASGGVVNIITKRPDTFTAQVGVHYNRPEGSAEGSTARTNFMVAGPAGERLTFRLNGNYNKSNPDALDINAAAAEEVDGTLLAGREGVINKDLGALLSWDAAPGHVIDFEANFSRQGNRYAGDSQLGSMSELTESLHGQETNRMYRRTFSATHRGEYDFGESNSYLQYESTSNTRLCEGTGGSGEGRINFCVDTDGDGTNDASEYRTIGLENLAAKTEWSLPMTLGGKTSNVTLGAELRGEFMDDAVSTTVTLPDTIIVDDTSNDPTQRDAKTKQILLGLYAEANIEWDDKLTLTPGLRFDHSDTFGTNLSPSLNAEYRFDENWTMKLGVARAFKAPNLFQLNPNYVYSTMGNGCPWVDGVRLSGPCYVMGNPDLDAEISLNKEIGIAYEGDSGMTASLTYFHNDYKNKIQSGQIQNNPDATTNRLFRWENTGPAVIEGLEGNFATPLTETLALNTNFTYMLDSRIKATGQPLSLVPDYTINASLDWEVRDDLMVMLSATHYGPIKSNGINAFTSADLGETNDRGGYTLVNLGTRWDATDNVRVSAGVTNLFDKQLYRTETSGGANTFNEPGRAFYISLNKTF
ncbi:MAG: FepA family TonB-dependent siderophore receptor [Paracoccus sp. (in: a-proteobacteria)]|uniref:FepA family TonB-dependent siderophore receptor n=1 Tax=Paracoccus sp. TaxID=267 RepID=UPI0026E058FF|nr:FepA family TonB-dependent siderophore receptor [Paracoccus sp. (in: a-proteobacteria)]MDO5622233.1 FepA family TonB-dependent siderophore receptor [Paracoccus sp. (in: a-proteobacteria)]